MQFLKLFSALLAFVILAGAAPDESGYGSTPKKREAMGRDDITTVRDDAVKPEEVFKNGVQEISLIATNTGYLPSHVIVRRNIPVRLFLTSGSATTMCFIMDDFSIKKAMTPQVVEEVRFLPTRVGQYKFYCPVNEIQGSVTVRD